MTTQQNKDLILRLVEAIYNQKDLDRFAEFFGEELRRQGGDHLHQFFEAFPDSRAVVQDLFGEGDKVVARLFMEGTNSGSFAGQPPTGKKIEFSSIRIYRIEQNKVVESWAMQDQLGLLKQLGFARTVGDVNWATAVEKD